MYTIFITDKTGAVMMYVLPVMTKHIKTTCITLWYPCMPSYNVQCFH